MSSKTIETLKDNVEAQLTRFHAAKDKFDGLVKQYKDTNQLEPRTEKDKLARYDSRVSLLAKQDEAAEEMEEARQEAKSLLMGYTALDIFALGWDRGTKRNEEAHAQRASG